MEENNLKWGTTMPIIYEDWTQTTVDESTGKEYPAKISIATAGSYSIEITNEEKFNIAETTMAEYLGTDYNWIRSLLQDFYMGYIEKKQSEKVGYKKLKSDVNDKNELLDYANKRLEEEYGGLGFVFKSITIDYLSSSQDEREESEKESQKNNNVTTQTNVVNNTTTKNTENATNSNANNSIKNEVIESVEQVNDKSYKEKDNNTFLFVGIIVAAVVTISLISVLLIKKLKK